MGHRLAFPNYDILLSRMIDFTLTNSVDPDEMLHNAAFHLGLHCLSKYPFRVSSIQSVDDLTLKKKNSSEITKRMVHC